MRVVIGIWVAPYCRASIVPVVVTVAVADDARTCTSSIRESGVGGELPTSREPQLDPYQLSAPRAPVIKALRLAHQDAAYLVEGVLSRRGLVRSHEDLEELLDHLPPLFLQV